jgi:hypothetical protein
VETEDNRITDVIIIRKSGTYSVKEHPMDAYPEPRNLSGPEIEYMSLREESLRRIEGRQQILSITLTLAGAFLGIGWGTGGAMALLIYPPLATLLAAGWVQNEVRIRAISVYIRDYLEAAIPGLGWERFSRSNAMQSRLMGFPIDILSTGGIFVLTQGLAIFLSAFRFAGSFVEFLMLIVDIVSIIALVLMVNYVRQQSTR